MSQPPFQPPPPPSQPPQGPNNPYNQPAPPQQAPGFGPPQATGQPPMQAPGQPPMHYGAPPVQGQPPMQPMHPMHPAPPFQAPFGQRPRASGHPVGAVFLGLFASVIVSLLYSGLNLVTYKDQSVTMGNTLYLGHALLNGAIVGWLVGLVGHRNTGAHVWGAVIAALGTFFGYTNTTVLVFADSDGAGAVWDLMRYEPFWPAKLWWTEGTTDKVDWFSPLGLVLAAAAAWGLAHLIGNRRRQP